MKQQQSTATVDDIRTMFDEVLPLRSDQEFVFSQLLDSIAYCENMGSDICEECGLPAPFVRASDGTPYLEVHHRQPLASDGLDTVDNAVAVCPNCHRKAHFA